LISKTDFLILHAWLNAFLVARTRIFFSGLSEVFKTTENWWAALAVYFSIRKSARIRFRDTSISFFVTEDNWSDYRLLSKLLSGKNIHVEANRFKFSYPSGLEFECDQNALDFFANSLEMDCYYNDQHDLVCKVAGLKFIMPFPYGTFELREIFIDKIYGEPYCKNAIIVDVGAFIGDSALFFANKGAKLVVAFEPVPTLFDILKKNIILNGFQEVIQARNEALSDQSGIFNIGYIPKRPGSSSENPEEKALFLEVPSITLSEVIMSLGWVDILKIDCEGCEYKILQHAGKSDALKHVGTIIMEVHSKVYSLIGLLRKKGFEIDKLRYDWPSRAWILSAHSSEQKTN